MRERLLEITVTFRKSHLGICFNFPWLLESVITRPDYLRFSAQWL